MSEMKDDTNPIPLREGYLPKNIEKKGYQPVSITTPKLDVKGGYQPASSVGTNPTNIPNPIPNPPTKK